MGNPNAAGVALAFPDLPSGAAFLARLPLADPPLLHDGLVRFQHSLLTAPPAPLAALQLLEQARTPLAFAQEELARRYLNRPLPLADQEETTFVAVTAAWRRMAQAYARVAQGLEPGQDTPERLALILHRCLHYTALAMVEHYRARRELEAGLWLELHGYFGSAEEWGVASLPVADPEMPEHGQGHCAAIYNAALLLELAGPYSLSLRQLELAWRWARLWAPLVGIDALAAGDGAPRFVVDLLRDGGLQPHDATADAPTLRRLDTSRLTLRLHQAHQGLKARLSPVDAGLGEGCSASQCVHLLALLFRPWSQTPALRRFRRHPGKGRLRLCVGWEALHYFVAGREFVQPDNVRVYSRQEFDSLFIFRHQVDPSQPLAVASARLAFAADTWSVANESAAGYRLRRDGAGQRLQQGQLVGVAGEEAEQFMLGQANWVMQERDGAEAGGLVAGISLLAGRPQAVAVRHHGADHSPSEPYVRAFLLPPVPSLEQGASLILPLGWYGARRQVEIHSDGTWLVQLEELLQGGADFERVSFSVCG